MTTLSQSGYPVPPRVAPPAQSLTPSGFIGVFLYAGLIAGLAQASIEVAGLFFVCSYLLLARSKPRLAITLMLAVTPFNNDVGGLPVKLAFSDLCMVLCLIALFPRWLGRGAKVAWMPAFIPVGAYLGLCVLSTAMTGFSGEAITSVAQMGVYLVLAVFFFSSVVTPEEILPGFQANIVSCCALTILMLVTRSNYVLGLHKNAVGTSLAIATTIALSLWLAEKGRGAKPGKLLTLGLIITAAGLLLSLSRGAWMGAIVAVTVILFLRGQVAIAVRATLLIVPVLAAVWIMLPAETREVATDFSTDSQSSSVSTRLTSIEYAYKHFKSSPVIGVGVGLRKMYDATNIVMSTLSETGILGLLLFLSIFVLLSISAYRASRRLPRHSLPFTLLTLGTGLVISKFVHGLADHFWSRGVLPVWAGFGLVAAGYAASRNALPRPGGSHPLSEPRTPDSHPDAHPLLQEPAQ